MASVWLLPSQAPDFDWCTTRSPPTTSQAAVGAVQPDVGGAVGVDDRVHGLEALASCRSGWLPACDFARRRSPGRRATRPRRSQPPGPGSCRHRRAPPRELRCRRASRSSASGSFWLWARRIPAIPRPLQPARHVGRWHQPCAFTSLLCRNLQQCRNRATSLMFRGRGSSSRPTVRPGWSAIWRSPSSTPGVKETRSSESCRMVRVSPTPPRTTSWWATSPRTRRPCTWMPSTSAPRAPSSPVEVASGTGPSPASRAGGRDQLRRTPGGAGGRVGLVGVVQLDDLHRLVERRGLGREPHHQHGADGEVGGDQHAGALARRRASRAACRAGRRRSRWCRRPRGCRGRCRTRGCPSPRRGG